MSAFSQLVSGLKKADPNLGTSDAVNLLGSLRDSINITLGNFEKKMSGVIGGMQPNFKTEVIELITKFNMGDDNEKLKAFEKIKNLQEKFNLNLNSFVKLFGINIKELNKAIDKMTLNEEKRVESLRKEKDLLQSEGIKYKIDDKGMVTPLDKKNQLIEIYDIQKQIADLEKRRAQFKKEIEKGEVKDFKTKIEGFKKEEDKLEERKIGVGYDDPNRPKTIKERLIGSAQGAGAFLRGERGPELVRGVMGGAYGALSSPIEAGRQIFQQVDMLTFGLTGALIKGLGNLLTPALKGLSTSFSKGFSFLGNIFTEKLGGLGKLILKGLIFLATFLGFNKIAGMLTNLAGTITGGAIAGRVASSLTGGTAAGAAGTATGAGATAAGTATGAGTGGGLLKTIARFLLPGLKLLAPFAPVAALAYINRPRNEEEAEFMKQNSEITSKETSSPEDLEGYNLGRKQARAAGEARIDKGLQFESLDKSLKMMKDNDIKPTDEASLRRKRERENDMPLPGEFAEITRENALDNTMASQVSSPVVNNVAPTNVQNTVQNLNQVISPTNKEPTINLINSRGYGYTVV